MNRKLLMRQVAAGVVLFGAAGAGYAWLYAAPKGVLRKQLTAQLSANAALEAELKDRKRVQDALKAIGAATLASTSDQADSRFRSALNAIASGAGLADVVVNSRKPIEQANPAGTSKLSAPSGLRTALRKQRDFAVIAGDVEGKGTLEQVLRAAAAIQAQPWVHRVESFSIKPEGRGRERFTLKLGVATLFTADLAPKDIAEPQVTLLDERARTVWASIVEKNMFKEPAAVAAAAPAPPPQAPSTPPPPVSPYADWRLTGVVESRLGPEAMLLNVKSQQRLALPAGGTLADARFVKASGEKAVFEIGGQAFEVATGQMLEQRRPASR